MEEISVKNQIRKGVSMKLNDTEVINQMNDNHKRINDKLEELIKKINDGEE